MDNSGSVSFGQSFSYLRRVLKQLLQLGPVLMDLFTECLSFDKFHHDEMDITCLSNLVYVRNIGMIQGGSRLRLLDEASQALLISSQISRQYLQRHSTSKLPTSTEIHLAHAAGSNER